MGGRLFIWFTVLLFCLKGITVITLFPGVRVMMFSACLGCEGNGSVVVESALVFEQRREHSLLSVLAKG